MRGQLPESDNMNEESLLEFPTEFPVKALGRDDPGFTQLVIELVAVHAQFDTDNDVRHQASGKGNFVSVTVTFRAENQEQIDRIYQDLHDHDLVLMVF
jgi:putative lipoic acid-binding regulatory protein